MQTFSLFAVLGAKRSARDSLSGHIEWRMGPFDKAGLEHQ